MRRAPQVKNHGMINDKLLDCYARRLPPQEAAKRSGVSLNTVYAHYGRFRDRLVFTGYYQDGALSLDEEGLSPGIQEELRFRRGVRTEEIFSHAAELIEWAEEWPPKLVSRHIRKIVELTGPLHAEPELNEDQASRLSIYVRYARTELILSRLHAVQTPDEASTGRIERAEQQKADLWRAYRSASKRIERSALKEGVKRK